MKRVNQTEQNKDTRAAGEVSIVGYVRLPADGYAQYLRAFKLRVEQRLLEAARGRAERLLAAPGEPVDGYADGETLLTGQRTA